MKLIKLFYLLKKVKLFFTNPKKSNLLVFDDTSIQDFEHILKNRDYFVLKTRYDQISEIYITFKVIFYIIKYINKNPAISYLIAIIKITKPKIVLTTIDNCFRFHEIANILINDGINFIAVQNAARYDFKKNNLLFSRNLIKFNPNEKFFVPNYYCFGDEEERDCRNFSINIHKFYKYGSLRLSNYLEFLKKNKIFIEKNYYDISILSESNTKLDTLWSQEGINEKFSILPKFVIKYCIKFRLKFLFITKRETGYYQDREMNFYKNHLSIDEYNFLLKNTMLVDKKNFSSYQAIHKSHLVVGSISTMLRDKLALQGKVLACNFTDLEFYDFPQKGICFLKKPSYDEFEKRSTEILNMKTEDYFARCEKKRLINLDKNKSTIAYINEHLDHLIKGR